MRWVLLEEQFAYFCEARIKCFGLDDVPSHHRYLIVVKYGYEIVALFPLNNFAEL